MGGTLINEIEKLPEVFVHSINSLLTNIWR